ncbi:DNA repair protein RAD50 [Xylariaceae sp. FL1651]|nr:DNA repair protein RAD50 [Xylariaceae sp. FL1651]
MRVVRPLTAFHLPDCEHDENPEFNKDQHFWAVSTTPYIIGILSALENTVVTTSLPFIVTQLELGNNHVWVTNIFFLTSATIQPLFGHLVNIFGRRYVTLAIFSLFNLGSSIADGARNAAALIVGRAIQGMGSGGINLIVDVIVSDLVPLRERGNYVGGVSLIMILLFLHVKSNKEMSFAQKLRRIDYLGNLLPIASTVSILFATTYGGLIGLAAFVFLETARSVTEPIVPPRLFANKTSATILASVLGGSPERAGVQLFPAVVIAIQAAIAAVLLLAKFGNNTIGLGLFSLMEPNTSIAEWVIFQIIVAGGSGFVLKTLLPSSIPATIFNTYFDQMAYRIPDPKVAAKFMNGKAYASATASYINSFPPDTRQEIISVYSDSLKYVWYTSVIFSGVSFSIVFLEKQIKMRTELETEFGMADEKKEDPEQAVAGLDKK